MFSVTWWVRIAQIFFWRIFGAADGPGFVEKGPVEGIVRGILPSVRGPGTRGSCRIGLVRGGLFCNVSIRLHYRAKVGGRRAKLRISWDKKGVIENGLIRARP